MKKSELKNSKFEEVKLEEVKLDGIELLEEGVTPSFGFGCPHGWFGSYCH